MTIMVSLVAFLSSTIIASTEKGNPETHMVVCASSIAWFAAALPACGICWRFGFTVVEEYVHAAMALCMVPASIASVLVVRSLHVGVLVEMDRKNNMPLHLHEPSRHLPRVHRAVVLPAVLPGVLAERADCRVPALSGYGRSTPLPAPGIKPFMDGRVRLTPLSPNVVDPTKQVVSVDEKDILEACYGEDASEDDSADDGDAALPDVAPYAPPRPPRQACKRWNMYATVVVFTIHVGSVIFVRWYFFVTGHFGLTNHFRPVYVGEGAFPTPSGGAINGAGNATNASEVSSNIPARPIGYQHETT